WNGVRNHRARNILRDEMKEGDLAFFYYSNAEPSAVAGIARIASAALPDPTQFDAKGGEEMGYDPKPKREAPTWWGRDVAFHEEIPRAVSLHEIKANPKLKEMALIKLGRLSVSPVRPAEWKEVLRMAKESSSEAASGPKRSKRA